ncbi:hypothetical protein MKX03_028791 [Papaver bracteatum]|nr:hypothetical protein MKX03_028791 [Papaver bracteatum]
MEQDLNEPPKEEHPFDLNQYPLSGNEDKDNDGATASVLQFSEIRQYDDVVANEFEPFIGQCFLSEEEAFLFYTKYADLNGFTIRHGRFCTNKNGEKTKRDFNCHCEGFAPEKIAQPLKAQRTRHSIRCGCKALMRISLRKPCEIFPEEWHVIAFVAEHNHDLLDPSQVRFLPSNRKIEKTDQDQLLKLQKAGLSIRQMLRVMELERNTFLRLMGKAPQTILTDQDPWMTKAIKADFPETKHSFCIWHITAKFSGWFLSTLRSKYFDWCSDFYKLYRLETVEEFEKEWFTTMSKYKLDKNKHIIGLFDMRRRWVPAFLRSYFFGGMTTTGRSESINSFIKRFIDSRSSLCQFIQQVDLAIQNIEQTEMHKQRIFVPRVVSPIEEQAQKTLTQFAFKKFREELVRASQYGIFRNVGYNYTMRYFQESKNTKRRKVYWDGKKASCSCKQFEFSGIICRHILSVLSHTDCFEIPKAFLPCRWRRNISCEEPCEVILQSSNNAVEITTNKNIELPTMVNGVTQPPPKSVTKGRPPTKRIKGIKETTKQQKICSYFLSYSSSSPLRIEMIEKNKN